MLYIVNKRSEAAFLKLSILKNCYIKTCKVLKNLHSEASYDVCTFLLCKFFKIFLLNLLNISNFIRTEVNTLMSQHSD